MSAPLPESLVIALEARHIAAVERWWQGLTSQQQTEFFEVALRSHSDEPNHTSLGQLDSDDDESPDDWYEYVVNQDARFYFDRANGEQTFHGYVVYPVISALSVAEDVEVVSHILRRPQH